MPGSFRLGFLSHLHGTAEPPRLFRDHVQLFAVAEELGFDSAGAPAVAVPVPRRGRDEDEPDPALAARGWSGQRLSRLTTMPSWLLRAMTTTASSSPGFSSRCGT
jgi:hypothetical protein